MKEIKTEIFIQAPIEKIWSILLDFSAYSAWNPFIRQIDGQSQIDQQLTVTIQPPPGKKLMQFKPRILSMSNYELRWLGTIWRPGIFDGVHSFKLEQSLNNKVKFVHSEKFSGLIHKPLFAMIGKSTEAGFISMNQALKERAEAS